MLPYCLSTQGLIALRQSLFVQNASLFQNRRSSKLRLPLQRRQIRWIGCGGWERQDSRPQWENPPGSADGSHAQWSRYRRTQKRPEGLRQSPSGLADESDCTGTRIIPVGAFRPHLLHLFTSFSPHSSVDR